MDVVKYGIYSGVCENVYVVLEEVEDNHYRIFRFKPKSNRNDKIQEEAIEILNDKKIDTYNYCEFAPEWLEYVSDGYIGKIDENKIHCNIGRKFRKTFRRDLIVDLLEVGWEIIKAMWRVLAALIIIIGFVLYLAWPLWF